MALDRLRTKTFEKKKRRRHEDRTLVEVLMCYVLDSKSWSVLRSRWDTVKQAPCRSWEMGLHPARWSPDFSSRTVKNRFHCLYFLMAALTDHGSGSQIGAPVRKSKSRSKVQVSWLPELDIAFFFQF